MDPNPSLRDIQNATCAELAELIETSKNAMDLGRAMDECESRKKRAEAVMWLRSKSESELHAKPKPA